MWSDRRRGRLRRPCPLSFGHPSYSRWPSSRFGKIAQNPMPAAGGRKDKEKNGMTFRKFRDTRQATAAARIRGMKRSRAVRPGSRAIAVFHALLNGSLHRARLKRVSGVIRTFWNWQIIFRISATKSHCFLNEERNEGKWSKHNQGNRRSKFANLNVTSRIITQYNWFANPYH